MIIYNMRYRGPLEYDKFVLNILQFHNDMFFRHSEEFNAIAQEEATLASLQNDITKVLDEVSVACESLYYEIIQSKECL